MPTLNLQQLISGDQISDLVTKINANFAQLATNGGGPQGSRGIQGPPGLPGLRGESGPSGDDGVDGQKVTIVNDDPNWPGVYAGNPAGTSPAAAAISAGYKEGDVWIDNGAGIFYDIHQEPSGSGIYVFKPHPISASVLTTGFWENDTSYSTLVDDVNQGVKLSHRFATLSLTSEQGDTPPTYSSSAYNLAGGLGNTLASQTYGYARPAFKISIDSLRNNSLGPTEDLRLKDNYSGPAANIIFGKDQGDMSPLMYLNSTNQGSNGVGIFHGVLETVGFSNTILSVKDTELSPVDPVNDYLMLLDLPHVLSTADDISFVKSTPSDSVKNLSFYDFERDGTKVSSSTLELWLALSSLQDTAQVFHGANPRYNSTGLRLKKYDDGTTALSTYVHGNITNGLEPLVPSTDHVMSVIQGGVHITSDDDVKDTPSKILRDFAFGVENDDTNWGRPSERIMALKNDRANPTNPGTFIGMGITASSTPGGAIYAAEGNTFPTINRRKLILNPGGTLLPNTIDPIFSPNNGDYGVSVGAEFESRFGVVGNFAVGTGTYKTTSAPDYGGIIQGQVAIGRDNAKPGNRLHVSDGGISLDIGLSNIFWPENYLGFNTYYESGDYKRTDEGYASHFKWTNTGTNTRLGYFVSETNDLADTTYTPEEAFAIVHASGKVGINPATGAAIDQRLSVNKSSTSVPEGLQILDSSSGMLGADAGLQFRLSAVNNTGQIGFTSSAQTTNDIEIYTAGESRQRILGEDGRIRIQTNSTTMLDPRGTASVDIASTDDNTRASVSMGTFEGENVQGLDSRMAGGYVGYNAEYDEAANAVTYHNRDDASNPALSAAGAISFVDNRGRFHVAVYKQGSLNTTEFETR